MCAEIITYTVVVVAVGMFSEMIRLNVKSGPYTFLTHADTYKMHIHANCTYMCLHVLYTPNIMLFYMKLLYI